MIVGIAFLIRYGLHPLIEPFAVFHFFIVGCLLIEFLFGYRYASVAIGISLLLAEYFFVEPYGTFSDLGRKDFIIGFNFVTVTGVAIAFMENLRRNIYARELLLKVTNSHHKVSLERENDRLFYARKSNEAWTVLEELLTDFDRILLIRFGIDNEQPGPALYRLVPHAGSGQMQPVHWSDAIAAEDELPLRRRLDDPNDTEVFRLRLREANGGLLEVPVQIERFQVMDRPLAVLRLASAADQRDGSA